MELSQRGKDNGESVRRKVGGTSVARRQLPEGWSGQCSLVRGSAGHQGFSWGRGGRDGNSKNKRVTRNSSSPRIQGRRDLKVACGSGYPVLLRGQGMMETIGVGAQFQGFGKE